MTVETLRPADFHRLGQYEVVLVSGPQRSGTNLVTVAIADATGLQYIPESKFQSTWPQVWWAIVQKKSDIVIHCPGMCRWVHMFGPLEDVAVVIVRRDVKDIIASQKRIGWEWEPYELMLYDRHPTQGPIAAVKYAAWDEVQKQMVVNAFEVEYESMREHPLWVPKEERADFARRQVALRVEAHA